MILSTIQRVAASAAALCFVGAPSAAATTVEQPLEASLRLATGSVVMTVTVPPAPEPVYVSRSYTYALYGTCWTKTGRPRLDKIQLMGTVRVPGSSGSYQMRPPGDGPETFTFTDPAQMLAHPPSALRPVVCPRNLVPAVYRADVGPWTVSVVREGGTEQTAAGDAGLRLFFQAP